MRRKQWNRRHFDFRFLDDSHVLECPEHDFTILTKCLSAKQKQILFKFLQRYSPNISFVYFEIFILRISMLKIFFHWGLFYLFTGEYCPTYTKIMYYLTIAFINKSFNFSKL